MLSPVILRSVQLESGGLENKSEIFAAYAELGTSKVEQTRTIRRVKAGETATFNHPMTLPTAKPWIFMSVDIFDSDNAARVDSIVRGLGKLSSSPIVKESLSTLALDVTGGIYRIFRDIRSRPERLGGGFFYVTPAGLFGVGQSDTHASKALTLPAGEGRAKATAIVEYVDSPLHETNWSRK